MNYIEEIGIGFILLTLVLIGGFVWAVCFGKLTETPSEQAERDKEALLAAANSELDHWRKTGVM